MGLAPNSMLKPPRGGVEPGNPAGGVPCSPRGGESAPRLLEHFYDRNPHLRDCRKQKERAMGFFSTKDWNVIAIIFEKHDLFRVNGNRGKGKDADAIRDGAKKHPRTMYWVVFDQKGGFLEGDV